MDNQDGNMNSPKESKKILPKIMGGIAYILECILLLLALAIIVLAVSVAGVYFMMYGPEGPPDESAPASSIVNNLRNLEWTARRICADSDDLFSKIPRDVNAIEYLRQFLRPPDWSGWNYYFFIISGDYWWIGYDMDSTRDSRRRDTRRTLAGRAQRVGLFGTSQPEPPPSADQFFQYEPGHTFVWMRVAHQFQEAIRPTATPLPRASLDPRN